MKMRRTQSQQTPYMPMSTADLFTGRDSSSSSIELELHRFILCTLHCLALAHYCKRFVHILDEFIGDVKPGRP